MLKQCRNTIASRSALTQLPLCQKSHCRTPAHKKPTARGQCGHRRSPAFDDLSIDNLKCANRVRVGRDHDVTMHARHRDLREEGRLWVGWLEPTNGWVGACGSPAPPTPTCVQPACSAGKLTFSLANVMVHPMQKQTHKFHTHQKNAPVKFRMLASSPVQKANATLQNNTTYFLYLPQTKNCASINQLAWSR